MALHEERNCPRCGNTFVCKAGNISNCQCNTVSLSSETTSFLLGTSFDCLCKDCLSQLNLLVKVAKMHSFPPTKELMIEGLHYYKENGSIVFTEMYHYLRGYCCNNGCRHCVYGFKKIKNEIS
jgi:hypothetical protein